MASNPALQHVAEKLLEYAQNKTTFQTDRIVRIPSSAYTDEAQWAREMETIFKTLPLCLATTAELRDANAFKAMDVIGLPILLTRGSDGVARAFLNVCAHRGAPVAESGCGIKSRFSCRYHGWTYGNDGRLLGVAGAKSFGAVDKSALNLTELPCEERAGLIFVCLTPGAAMDVDAFMAGMLGDLERLDFCNWAFLGKREIVGANWKIAFDGYLEGYHFAMLHPETIHPRTLSNLTHYEAFGPHLRIGFAQRDIAQKLGAAPRENWGAMENDGYDFVRILFPNVSLFLAPEITQLAQLFPGPTPDKNKTVLTFFRREGPRDDDDKTALEGMMDWLKTVVRDEDYEIGLKIQQGLASGAHESIVLGRNERGNQYFHEWVDWYLAGDPAAPQPRL